MPTGVHTLSPSPRIPGASAAQEEQASSRGGLAAQQRAQQTSQKFAPPGVSHSRCAELPPRPAAPEEPGLQGDQLSPGSLVHSLINFKTNRPQAPWATLGPHGPQEEPKAQAQAQPGDVPLLAGCSSPPILEEQAGPPVPQVGPGRHARWGTEPRTASPSTRKPHSPTGRKFVLRKGRMLSRSGPGSSGEGTIAEGPRALGSAAAAPQSQALPATTRSGQWVEATLASQAAIGPGAVWLGSHHPPPTASLLPQASSFQRLPLCPLPPDGASEAWPSDGHRDTRAPRHPEPRSAQVGKTAGAGGRTPPKGPSEPPYLVALLQPPGKEGPVAVCPSFTLAGFSPQALHLAQPPQDQQQTQNWLPPRARQPGAPSQACPSPSLLPQEFPGVLHVPRAQRGCHASPACPPKPGWARIALHRPTSPPGRPLAATRAPGSPAVAPPRRLDHHGPLATQPKRPAPALAAEPATARAPSRPHASCRGGSPGAVPRHVCQSGAGRGARAGLAQSSLIRQQHPPGAEARPRRAVSHAGPRGEGLRVRGAARPSPARPLPLSQADPRAKEGHRPSQASSLCSDPGPDASVMPGNWLLPTEASRLIRTLGTGPDRPEGGPAEPKHPGGDAHTQTGRSASIEWPVPSLEAPGWSGCHLAVPGESTAPTRHAVARCRGLGVPQARPPGLDTGYCFHPNPAVPPHHAPQSSGLAVRAPQGPPRAPLRPPSPSCPPPSVSAPRRWGRHILHWQRWHEKNPNPPTPAQLVWLHWAWPEHPAFLDPLPRSPLVSTPGWTPGPRLPRADTARYLGIKRMARLLPRAPNPALPIPLPAPPKLPAESPQVGPSLPKASPEAPSHTEPAYSRIPATPAQPPGWEWGPRWRSPDDGATGQGSPVA
ncbi:basic proline-rich protein-like [Eubalaena glacialis]|uniref:basic proline-rich protein-like n=1 Tax=Eubalaena glacialis TaxID=27606 RepID=UPI002A5A5B48|nr:basic proline-rich protein-like [Eubalaena glacialis]